MTGRLERKARTWQQCELVLGERERTMCFELDRFSEGLFFTLFDTPDRVSTCCGVFAIVNILASSPTSRPNLPPGSKNIIGAATHCLPEYSTRWTSTPC